jgi:hypothetical protein
MVNLAYKQLLAAFPEYVHSTEAASSEAKLNIFETRDIHWRISNKYVCRQE